MVQLHFALTVVFLVQGALSVQLTKNHQGKVTASEGDSVDLICTANVKAEICFFRGPNGQSYGVLSGSIYEGGRIAQKSNSENDCGLTISSVKDEDNGLWTCSVTAVNPATSGTVTEDEQVEVVVALPPAQLQLQDADAGLPIPRGSQLEVQMDQIPDGGKKIECIADKARPKPEFKWMIGNTELNAIADIEERDVTPDGKATYVSTLEYFATAEHNNQELKCVVTHIGYSQAQLAERSNEVATNLVVLYPPQEKKEETFYNMIEGQENKIRIKFEANPEPTEMVWNVNGQSVAANGASVDNKYSAGPLENGDIDGQYVLELTIHKMEKDMADKKNTLMVKNPEGEVTYSFRLALGDAPPAAGGSGEKPAQTPVKGEQLGSGPIVGIIIVVIIVLILIGIAVIARAKGLLCFAVKPKPEEEDTEAAVEKEGSDTESAEDTPAKAEAEAETAKPTVASRVSNLFAAVKKSVKKPKDKYTEQTESEVKVPLNENEEKKDPEKDDVTYADLDKSAMTSGTRSASVTSENEKTEYAEIQPKKN